MVFLVARLALLETFHQNSEIFNTTESVDLPFKDGPCVGACFDSFLGDCDQIAAVECLKGCDPEIDVKDDVEPITECQALLVSCYENFLEKFDLLAYVGCQFEAWERYGTEDCQPCSSTDSSLKDYIPEVPKITSPKIPIDCLSACYLEGLQTCLSEDEQLACRTFCYPPPAPGVTEKCQEEVLDCIADLYDTDDPLAFITCLVPVGEGYGEATCMPCLLKEARSISLESVALPPDGDKECALECIEHYMNDCDDSGTQLCLNACVPESDISVVVESTRNNQSW
eukprot:CAMPEP_0114995836 /NCGR_PEP_ID=MMETSP0216-20121206/13963_1 /TAXON_ID=223996 /ORGANISM="Protocruzia adherens, Strain Boccale" /LENGTH=283 /DNA_ID=CAMNT_0002359947 /DNA_START=558 /DNA_END=1405 /DNA_ORIENTATION=+